MPDYISKHQVRNGRRGGGVSIYIHSSLKFKKRPDLSIISKDIEMLTLEILSDKTRNILVNVLYRPPVGQYEQFKNFLTTFFSRTKNCNKDVHIAGDFNLNLLDHDTNKKVQNFLNLIYQNCLIRTINKPTRVTMKTATAIDHILTNSFLILTLNQLFLKLIFLTISLFAFRYHYRHLLSQKMKPPFSKKELLALIQLKCLNKNYIKLIGKKLKRIKTLMKLTKFF